MAALGPLAVQLLVAVALWRRAEAVADLVTGLSMPKGIALDTQAGRMYWTEEGLMMLRSARLDGTDIKDVIVRSNPQEAPHDVAVDPWAEKVYWTALCCGVRRANFDGSGEEVIASAEYASGIVLDSLRDTVYWTDWMNGRIWRANVSSPDSEELVAANLASPVDIALYLEAENDRIYWSDIGHSQVKASLLDGQGIQALNTSWAITHTYGLAIDMEAKKLYLTDYEKKGGDFTGRASDYLGRIIRTGLDGADSEVLVSEPGMSMPYGIATSNGMVYWTDRKSGKIQRLALHCPNGTTQLDSRTNSSQVQVQHGAADHGSSISATCPLGYTGSVTLACNDGQFSLSEGKCGKRCDAGSVVHRLDSAGHGESGDETADLVLEHEDMDDGQVLPLSCPSPLVGAVQIVCQGGSVLLSGQHCRAARPCAAGSLLLGNSLLQHSELQHGLMESSVCPPGFQGKYFLLCQDGTIVQRHNSSCRATCDTGSLWVDDGAVEVSHGRIIDGGSMRVLCPAGSAGDGVYLSCNSGFINITESTCKRQSFCAAGSLTSGHAQVEHQSLDDGERLLLECPQGFSGSLNITCVRSQATVLEGRCHRGCSPGWALDSLNNPIRHGDVNHGNLVLVSCPEGFHGSIPLHCLDGNMTLACADGLACSCIEDDTQLGVRSDLPAAALAAAVTAAVLLLMFTTGLLRHRVIKRRAMQAAVAAAVGDILPAPESRSSVLPKSGCASDSSAFSRGGGARRDIEAFGKVVIDVPAALPLYWATSEGIHIFPDPNRISEVQQLMTDTWRNCYTRDRRLVAGAGRVPVGCRVANVLRIENHRAHAQYSSYKDHLRSKKSGPCTPFPTLTSNRLNYLEEDLNERYLFHGTNPESAHAIARDFFSIDRAGSSAGCMFGRGIYLAENASKSDEYAKEGAGVYTGLCAMLICRCVLGDVLTVSRAGDMEEQARSGGYDCVCGDRLAEVGTFRELVFFDEEAAYAEFIVIYTQIFES